MRVSRQALAAQRMGGHGGRSMERSRPAPVGGWNTRDPVTDMPAQDAVVLTNWFPDHGEVRIRPGYTSHATGVGSSGVETMAALEAGTVSKMLAGGNGQLYDVTSTGAATSLASGFSSNRWQHAVFNATMGLVNGQDAPQTYDGTTVAAMTISGTGLTATNLVGINVHKSRTYFWERNSADFWYSAVNALGGAVTRFQLGQVAASGGNLVAMATWTLDGGEGRDDLAVFLMSSGETIVYQGSDPGDAADWALVGRYQIPPPIDRRAIVKLGGDLLVITRGDIVPLSRALPRRNEIIEQSKLSGAITEAARSFGGVTGWDAILVPSETMVAILVPMSTTRACWFGYNTVTNAPFRYDGLNARSWTLFNNRLYFGGIDGGVYKFGDGANSDVGANIDAEAQPAWTRLGNRSGLIHVSAIRPVVSADGELSIGRGIAYDFASVNVGISTSTPAAGADWDLSSWDVTSWSPEESVRATWLPVNGGEGRHISPRIRVSTKNQTVRWFSLDYLFQRGKGL